MVVVGVRVVVVTGAVDVVVGAAFVDGAVAGVDRAVVHAPAATATASPTIAGRIRIPRPTIRTHESASQGCARQGFPGPVASAPSRRRSRCADP